MVGICRAFDDVLAFIILLTLPSPSNEFAPEYEKEDCFCNTLNLSSISLFCSVKMVCNWLGNSVN